MAKSQSLASMSVDALLKLRDNIGLMLSKKAGELQRQLASLTGGESSGGGKRRGRPPGKAHSLKGRTVAPKYRSPDGVGWAGRGATPRWLQEAMKGGAKKEDFLIAKSAAVSKKSASKKSGRKKKAAAA
jgi:DNA-binding protein H-NS